MASVGGKIGTLAHRPAVGTRIGDTYHVTDTDTDTEWNGATWVSLDTDSGGGSDDEIIQGLIDDAIAELPTIGADDPTEVAVTQVGEIITIELLSSIARTAAVQPLNAANLSAIAALTTTPYGRSLLEAANAAALRTLAGLVLGTDVYSKAAVDALLLGIRKRFAVSGPHTALVHSAASDLTAFTCVLAAGDLVVGDYLDFELALTHTNGTGSSSAPATSSSPGGSSPPPAARPPATPSSASAVSPTPPTVSAPTPSR